MRNLLAGAVMLLALVGPVAQGAWAHGAWAANAAFGESALCEDVTLQVGQKLSLSLAENPTTGYRWSCAWTPVGCLKLTRDQYVGPSVTGRVGVGGTRYFTLLALAPGDCRVDIQYARPWKGGGADTPRSLHVVVVPPTTGPAPPPVINVTETDFRPHQVVALGAFVSVTLPENPTTGFTWKTWWGPADALRQTSDEYVAPTGPRLGQPGLHRWIFKTLATGVVVVYFQSGQPWSGGRQDLPRLLVLQIPPAS